jgi:hypothetical protein
MPSQGTVSDTSDFNPAIGDTTKAWGARDFIAASTPLVDEIDLTGGSWLRSKQREPIDLSSLFFKNASAGRHHRCCRSEEDPALLS